MKKMNSVILLVVMLVSTSAFADSFSCDVPTDSSGRALIEGQGRGIYFYNENADGTVALEQVINGTENHLIGNMSKISQSSTGQISYRLGNVTVTTGSLNVDDSSSITVSQNGINYTAQCHFIQE